MKRKRTKGAVAFVCCAVLLVVMSVSLIIVLPMAFGSSWANMGVWAPYSLYTGIIAFTLLSIAICALAVIQGMAPGTSAGQTLTRKL